MHDVIIAGGGVGGLHLASRLKDLDVLVLERNKEITLRDSGIVSKDFLKFFSGKGLIKDEITHMELLSGKEAINLRTTRPFAYILKRERLTKHLRKAAAKTAEIRYETVTGVDYSDGVTVRTAGGSHRCRLVVGSDGCGSIVRRAAGIRETKMCMGLMAITEKKEGRNVKVFFNKHYSPDFFSWLIPQNREYGMISSVRPREYLEFFRKRERLAGGKLYAYPIPLGFTKSFSKNTLLIGDSCGQVKPLTGGGIMFSLRAAVHAQKAISHAFLNNRFDENSLGNYERLWKGDFGSEIAKELLFRRLYRRLSNPEIDSLFRDFRDAMESLDYFDYDRFSDAWIRLPKIKLLKAALLKSPVLLGRGFI